MFWGDLVVLAFRGSHSLTSCRPLRNSGVFIARNLTLPCRAFPCSRFAAVVRRKEDCHFSLLERAIGISSASAKFSMLLAEGHTQEQAAGHFGLKHSTMTDALSYMREPYTKPTNEALMALATSLQ